MNIEMTLALRYLQGRKLRTTLTTLAIVFGVMILFGLGAIIPTMQEVFRQDVMTSSGKVDLTLRHISDGTFGVDRADALRSVEGIAQSSASLRQSISMPPSLIPSSDPKKALTALTVIGIDPATAASVRSYPVVSGRFLTQADSSSMLLPESLARQLGLSAGDHMKLPSADGAADFTIAGILGTRSLPGEAEAYVPLAAAQRLLNQPGQVNVLEALFSAGADRAKVEGAVRAQMGEGFSFTPVEDSSSVFSGAIDIGSKAMSMIGMLALIMGGFIIFNTFRTIVAERRRDLGMLRAMGATRGMIMKMILVEGLIQGVIGTALGLFAGYGLALLAGVGLNPIMQQYWNRRVGMPPVTADNLMTAIVMGVGITVVSGLLPARSATRVSPLESLRPSVPGVQKLSARKSDIVAIILLVVAALTLLTGNRGLVLLGALLVLVGLVMIAPLLVRPLASTFGRLMEFIFAREGSLAAANINRQPSRAAITASAVMISLAIIIGVAGMLSSVLVGIVSYSDKSLGADYLIMPASLVLSGGNVGAGPALADQIRKTPGVGEVTTLRLAMTSVNGKALQVLGIDPVSYPQIAGLIFTNGKEEDAYAALSSGRAVIINGIFGAQNKTKLGDVLALQTAEGMQNYRVVGIGLDYLNAKIATAYVSQGNLAKDFHQTSDVLLMANRAGGADAGAVRSAMEALVAGYPTFTMMDSSSFRANQQQTFQAMSIMLSILLIALAAPGLIAMINTLAISVIERTREIGMLRAVGSTRRQIRRMIQAESLLLAALGTAFGILAGLWLGYALVGSMNLVGFVIAYSFPTAGLLAGIAAGLLLGVLAATIPARQAAKMDIIKALRYE